MGKIDLAFPLNGCEPTKTSAMDSDHPIIMLAIRGNCTFAKKAINAQNSGAVALIVMDNKTENVETVLPYVKDRSLAQNISIPTLLVSAEQSGDLFDEVFRSQHQIFGIVEGKEVVVSLEFPIDKRTEAVVDFKFDLTDYESFEYFLELSYFFKGLNEKIKFNPVYNFEYLGANQSPRKGHNCVKFDSQKVCALSQSKPKTTNLEQFSSILLTVSARRRRREGP